MPRRALVVLVAAFIAVSAFAARKSPRRIPVRRPVPSLCPQNLSLRHLTQFAAQYVSSKPRACVKECFGPYMEKPVFTSASAADQEQFLFLYLQASLFAAQTSDPETRRRGAYQTAQGIAHQYVNWYEQTPSARTLPTSQRRIRDVVFQTGDAYAELQDWAGLINAYSGYARTELLLVADERSLTNWYKALRTRGADKERTLSQVCDRIRAGDDDYRDDWVLFSNTLKDLRARIRYGTDVDRMWRFATRVLA